MHCSGVIYSSEMQSKDLIHGALRKKSAKFAIIHTSMTFKYNDLLSTYSLFWLGVSSKVSALHTTKEDFNFTKSLSIFKCYPEFAERLLYYVGVPFLFRG